MEVLTWEEHGTTVVLRLDGLADAAVAAWARGAVADVATWAGRLGPQRLVVELRGEPGGGVHGGVAWPGRTPLVVAHVGRASSATDLGADWVLVHELTHVLLPPVADRHHWFEEGFATYAEPWARTRAGHLDAAVAWADLVKGLPQGQPQPGELGIDHTPTWGRTYWGGALFWLVVDVGWRRDGGPGVQQAVGALAATGGMARPGPVPLPSLLRTMDEVAGDGIALPTWRQWSDQPVTVDLDAQWSWLGVRVGPAGVLLDDDAPGAHARHAIDGTAPRP